MATANTYTSPGAGPADGRVRLELARRSALLELAEVFGTQLRVIAEEPPVAEVPEALVIRQLEKDWRRRGFRIIERLVVVAISAALAAWVGYQVGSGGTDSRDRYYGDDVAAGRAEIVQYGTPEPIDGSELVTREEWKALMRLLQVRETN